MQMERTKGESEKQDANCRLKCIPEEAPNSWKGNNDKNK